MPYRDLDSFTPADAAHFEQIRGESYETDSRPDAREVRADMAGLSDGGEHDCTGDDCLCCAWDRMGAA